MKVNYVIKLEKRSVKIAAISVLKRKLHGSKQNNNYIQFYCVVKPNEQAQSHTKLMIHKSNTFYIHS